MNDGTRFFSTLSTVVIASVLHCTAQAATLEYFGGNMRAQADSCVETPCISRLVIDEQSAMVSAPSHAGNAPEPPFEPHALAGGDGYVETDADDADLRVELSGWALANSSATGKSIAYGNAKTVQQNYTEGLFFEVTAQGDESSGDAVDIHYAWTAFANSSSEGWGILSGGSYTNEQGVTTQNPMAITLNGDDVWSQAVIDGYSVEVDESDTGVFRAEIGDIIGIHLLAGAFASVEGLGFEDADVMQEMALTVASVPIPAALWLFGSALVGLGVIKHRRP